ncbi:MAG TPA: SPOR domain-containing protein [Candidatus Angelobacter sp.]
MQEPQDTEITLGTGKLLGIFFVLVAICAVFFTMGYLLGRSSTPPGSSTTIVSSIPTANSNSGNKPSANGAKPTDSAGCPAGSPNCVAASYAPNSAPQSSPAVTSSKPPDTGTPAGDNAPEIKAVPSGSYTVQVAAISKQEDADILVNALRKKQYPVFVASSPTDALFHVQVGPFSDAKDAEAMRSRLAADGYNAIVKK